MSKGTFNIDELKERAQSGNVIFRSKTVLTLIGIIEQLIYDAKATQARAEKAEARLSDVEAVLKGCGFKIVKDRYRGGRLILVGHSCEYIPTQDVFPKGGE